MTDVLQRESGVQHPALAECFNVGVMERLGLKPTRAHRATQRPAICRGLTPSPSNALSTLVF